jgi:hypothetical protein
MRATRSRTTRLDRWRKGADFRQIASASARANLATFAKAPRCGAARKRDGEPCCNPAMKNGRCTLHGGKTPSGKQWHVVQYPDCSTPQGEAKFNRKLRMQKRYAEKRAARVAAMTPEQRARHEAWHRTHKPGAGAARNTERARARHNAQIRLLLSSEATCPPQSSEMAQLLAERAAVTAELERLDAEMTENSCNYDGIFA